MVRDYNTDLIEDERNPENESLDFDISDRVEHDKDPSSKFITKDTIISEVVDSHPDIIPILMEKGMHCIGCGASMFETLEEGFIGHGMENDEIERIIDELNAYIKNLKE